MIFKIIGEFFHKLSLAIKYFGRGCENGISLQRDFTHFDIFGRRVAFHLRGCEYKGLVAVNLFAR